MIHKRLIFEPEFLRQVDLSVHGEEDKSKYVTEDDIELKNVKIVGFSKVSNDTIEYLENRFSDWLRLRKLVATMILFVNNCRKKNVRTSTT